MNNQSWLTKNQLSLWSKTLFLGLFFSLTLTGCGRQVNYNNMVSGENQQSLALVKLGNIEMKAEYSSSGSRNPGGGLTYTYLPGTEGVLYKMPKREISYFNALGLDQGADFIWIDCGISNRTIEQSSNVAETTINQATGSAQVEEQDSCKVVDIDREVKPEKEVEAIKQKLYDSSVPATHMLEVKKDWVRDKGIRMGDNVQIQKPNIKNQNEN